MQINVDPKIKQFIEEQVSAGHYASTDEVIHAALEQFMFAADLELDEPTLAAIDRAEAEIDAGGGMSFDEFATEVRKRTGMK